VIVKGLCGSWRLCLFLLRRPLNALEMGPTSCHATVRRRVPPLRICYMICPTTASWMRSCGTGSVAAADRRLRERPLGPDDRRSAARFGDGRRSGHRAAPLLLDRHLIDGAIVSRKTSVFGRRPLIATTREELIAAAGSHFGGSSHLEELATSTRPIRRPSRRSRGWKTSRLQRMAVVGTPCQIRSIKRLQCLGICPRTSSTIRRALLHGELFLYSFRPCGAGKQAAPELCRY